MSEPSIRRRPRRFWFQPAQCFISAFVADDAQHFAAAGYTTVEELAFVPLPELLVVAGLERERILEIRERARKCIYAGLKGGPEA